MRQILALMIIDWAWRQQTLRTTGANTQIKVKRLFSLSAGCSMPRSPLRQRKTMTQQTARLRSPQSDFYQVKHFQSNKPDFMWTEGFICKMTPKPQWQTSSNDLCVDAANIHILTLSVFISSSVNFLNSRSTYIINELLIVSVFKLKFVASEKNPDSH